VHTDESAAPAILDLDGPLPRYADLPHIDALGGRHSWGLFPDPNLGTLNLLTPARRATACAAVRTGETVNLSLPMDQPDPPLPGRQRYTHTVFSPHRNGLDEEIDGFYPQGSSQWDGFKHVAAREYGWYGGLTRQDLDAAGAPLGVGHWAERGIVGRGVLVDMVAHWQSQGRTVGPTDDVAIAVDDLVAALSTQQIGLQTGDVLILRTGWLEKLDAAERAGRQQIMDAGAWPGLAADESMASFLWDQHVAAVAADNRAVEVAPGDPKAGYLHRRLLPLLGIPLGELWQLAALAQRCRQQHRYDFLLVSIPLNLPAGVGSPANAVAIF
jgi:kynurenine formamidase